MILKLGDWLISIGRRTQSVQTSDEKSSHFGFFCRRRRGADLIR